ncbi:hypothetical protein RI129_010653, partial [Pyrocoelia pectoralis]
ASTVRPLPGTTIEEGNSPLIHSHPHQVSIRCYGQHTCGGSIIDEVTVLTAGHCFKNDDPTNYEVVAGINSLKEVGQTTKVQRIIRPTDYKEFLRDDIAILKLKGSLKFNDQVKPIPIFEDEVGGGVDCIASGWGRTRVNGSSSQNLKELTLKTITFDECRSKQPYKNDFVNHGHICAFMREGEGICVGDSGGPLVCNGQLIGITSWMWPCGVGYPDVFTRLSKYFKWIMKEWKGQC